LLVARIGREHRSIGPDRRAREPHGQVEYVLNGKRSAPFDPGFQATASDPDIKVFRLNAELLGTRYRALFLSAAGADHEAEEGFVRYDADGIAFTRSPDESDEQKAAGHGLYTFALLSNLLLQLPTGTNTSGLLMDAK